MKLRGLSVIETRSMTAFGTAGVVRRGHEGRWFPEAGVRARSDWVEDGREADAGAQVLRIGLRMSSACLASGLPAMTSRPLLISSSVKARKGVRARVLPSIVLASSGAVHLQKPSGARTRYRGHRCRCRQAYRSNAPANRVRCRLGGSGPGRTQVVS